MTREGRKLQSTAVRNLHALGLSEYAARTLVALVRIDGGSAREVSDSSSVPRTRVYDAVEELADRGFVRVRETHPKEFTPVSPRRIRRAFYREYVYRQVVAELGLRAIGTPSADSSDSGLVVATGTEVVARRFRSSIAGADDRLTYVSVGDAPSAGVLDAIDAANDRGVAVRIVVVGDAGPVDVDTAVPDATVLSVRDTATPPNDRSRFLVADDTVALLGTWVDGTTEVGLFSEGTGSDVVALLQQVVDTWLADAE
ncbi:hypothetical protein OB920_00870 [Halobacteria archaeon HArc-gm2]|nr:hypothetical protein [Halobacteria archaeon HArc-gm2]